MLSTHTLRQHLSSCLQNRSVQQGSITNFFNFSRILYNTSKYLFKTKHSTNTHHPHHQSQSTQCFLRDFSLAEVFWVGAHNSLSPILVGMNSNVITIQNSVQRYIRGRDELDCEYKFSPSGKPIDCPDHIRPLKHLHPMLFLKWAQPKAR